MCTGTTVLHEQTFRSSSEWDAVQDPTGGIGQRRPKQVVAQAHQQQRASRAGHRLPGSVQRMCSQLNPQSQKPLELSHWQTSLCGVMLKVPLKLVT